MSTAPQNGGGILPDIELETAKFSPITTALLKDSAIFDYATEYYYKNPMTDWKGFQFSETDFKDFLGFLKRNNFEYETKTEKEFAEAMRRAEDDELADEIESSYSELLASIDRAKEKNLISKKAEINSLLSDEILKRYFYKQGLYDYQVEHNAEILKAVSILKDTKKYNRILN